MSGWRLKKPEGAVYGPVDWPEVLQWAAHGRIGPEDTLSADGVRWIPAPSVPELNLVWVVTLDDGSKVGPYHASTLVELLAEGAVSGNTRLHQAVTHAPATVVSVLKAARLAGEIKVELGPLSADLCGILREPEALSSPPAESAGTAPPPLPPQNDGAPTAPDLDALRQELAAARETIARLEADNRQAAQQHQQMRPEQTETAVAERQALNARLESLQQDVTAARAENEALQTAARQASAYRQESDAARARDTAEQQRLNDLLLQAQQEAEAVRLRAGQLEAAASQTSQQMEFLSGERDGARQELARLKAARAAELARHESESETLRRELTSAQDGLARERQENSRQLETLRQQRLAPSVRDTAEQQLLREQLGCLKKDHAAAREHIGALKTAAAEAAREILTLREALAAAQAQAAAAAAARQQAEGAQALRAAQQQPVDPHQPAIRTPRPQALPGLPAQRAAGGVPGSSDLYRIPLRKA